MDRKRFISTRSAPNICLPNSKPFFGRAAAAAAAALLRTTLTRTPHLTVAGGVPQLQEQQLPVDRHALVPALPARNEAGALLPAPLPLPPLLALLSVEQAGKSGISHYLFWFSSSPCSMYLVVVEKVRWERAALHFFPPHLFVLTPYLSCSISGSLQKSLPSSSSPPKKQVPNNRKQHQAQK